MRLTQEDRKAIRARIAAATVGPWGWWHRPQTPAILAVPAHGLLVVMDAVRRGMQGATLRFAKRDPTAGGLLYKVEDMSPDYDPRGSEFIEVNNPDAMFIAHARTDVEELLDELVAVEKDYAEAIEVLCRQLRPAEDVDLHVEESLIIAAIAKYDARMGSQPRDDQVAC